MWCTWRLLIYIYIFCKKKCSLLEFIVWGKMALLLGKIKGKWTLSSVSCFSFLHIVSCSLWKKTYDLCESKVPWKNMLDLNATQLMQSSGKTYFVLHCRFCHRKSNSSSLWRTFNNVQFLIDYDLLLIKCAISNPNIDTYSLLCLNDLF